MKFEDVKAGQRIRVTTKAGVEIVGLVHLANAAYIALGRPNDGDTLVWRGTLDTIELLSEPVPEGTLAEIDWAEKVRDANEPRTDVAWRVFSGWRLLPNKGLLYDRFAHVTAVRPMKLVPAEAGVINPERVLKMTDRIYEIAGDVRGAGYPGTADVLLHQADAIADIITAQARRG
jgi:hypothetical protein